MGKCLDGGLQNIVSALPSGGSGDVRRSAYVRTAFGVHAHGVRCTCVQRSAYVVVRVESNDEGGIAGVT